MNPKHGSAWTEPSIGADAMIDGPSDGKRRTIVAHRQVKSGVYLLGAAGADLIKIGWIADVSKVDVRLGVLQTGCPYELVLLFMVTPADRRTESNLHKMFRTEHFRGEWFSYRGKVKAFIDLSQSNPSVAIEDALRYRPR